MLDTGREYLRGELQRLDLLLHREILRLRASYQLSLDEFRGLYVSDSQVDDLLREAPDGQGAPDPAGLTERAVTLHRSNLELLDDSSPWSRLRQNLSLSPFEVDALLLALAIEVHPRYETLFAYLNNDVSRKWPTCDLAFRLFADEEPWQLRSYLTPNSRLFSRGLLRTIASSSDRISLLSSGFALSPELSRFLLAIPPSFGKLNEFLTRIEPQRSWDDIPLAAVLHERLKRAPEILAKACNCGESPLTVLVGNYGMMAEQIAEALSTQLRRPLVRARRSCRPSDPCPGAAHALARAVAGPPKTGLPPRAARL